MQSQRLIHKLMALGFKTAVAVQSGKSQEPERHIPVSGQVRGYLCWYDSLASTKGYWPLAETIAFGLRDGVTYKTIKQVTELFAGEWGSSPEQVREEMTATVYAAVDANPSFALLVMGGAPRSNFLLTFIKASVIWLKLYMITLRPAEWGQKEAVWVRQRAKQFLTIEETPYISAGDFLIVQELHNGLDINDLTQKFGLTAEKLNAQYQQAVERANLILTKISKFQVPAGQKDWSVRDYLNAMGLPPPETAELETAIHLGAEQPALLEHMAKQFYPALGKAFGCTGSAACNRIRTTIDKLSKKPNNVKFFRYAGFYETGCITTKNFIQAFLRYTETERSSAPDE